VAVGIELSVAPSSMVGSVRALSRCHLLSKTIWSVANLGS